MEKTIAAFKHSLTNVGFFAGCNRYGISAKKVRVLVMLCSASSPPCAARESSLQAGGGA